MDNILPMYTIMQVKSSSGEILSCVRDSKEVPTSQDVDIKAASDITLRGLLIKANRAAKEMTTSMKKVRRHLQEQTVLAEKTVSTTALKGG